MAEFKILSLSGVVLFTQECASIRECLEAAIKSRVNLTWADLSGANLTGANLTGAYLSGANLSGANLTRATGAALAIAQTRILPPQGEVVGWKKLSGGVIAKVKVPAKARRSHALGRKCRAEYVKVVGLFPAGTKEGYSLRGTAFVYRKGATIAAHAWEEDWTQECAPGIHFFITREEAEAYRG